MHITPKAARFLTTAVLYYREHLQRLLDATLDENEDAVADLVNDMAYYDCLLKALAEEAPPSRT
jgi:hypothetical protein